MGLLFGCVAIVVSVTLSIRSADGLRLLGDDKKIRVYIEADAPENVDQIKLEYNFRPTCNESQKRSNIDTVYKNCRDVPSFFNSGVYNINLDGKPFEVYCDLNPDGNKYLVIQRRMDGSQDFYKTWKEYEDGFGDIRREFWIGNKVLHRLTSQEKYRLRIDMEANDTSTAYADYSTFSVGSPETKYKLNVGGYSGNAGDSLIGHNGQMFTTYDRDNDEYTANCAALYKGAWWYKGCHSSNLNGKYYGGHHDTYADGVNWNTFKGYYESLKNVTMKIY